MWKQTVTPIRTLADAELTCIFQMSRVAEIITRIRVLRIQLIPKFLCHSLFIFTSATSTATTYCKNYLFSLLAKLDGSSFDVPRLSLGELKHLLVKMGNLSNPTANSTVSRAVALWCSVTPLWISKLFGLEPDRRGFFFKFTAFLWLVAWSLRVLYGRYHLIWGPNLRAN